MMDRILLVEPDAEKAELFDQLLSFDVVRVPDLESASRYPDPHHFRTVLVNVAISDDKDLELFRTLNETFSDRLVRTSSRREGDLERMLHGLGSQLGSENNLESIRNGEFNGERLLLLGQIASGIAHDFNQILTLVRANAEYLLSFEDARNESEELERSLSNIRHATETAAIIVERLRSFYGPSEEDLAQTHHNLSEIVKFTVELTRVGWHNKALSDGKLVSIDLALEDECWIHASRASLIQVVMNLIFNAVAAIDVKGEIRIATRRDGNQVLLSVEDDGCGMTEDSLRNCFVPFYSTSEKGTGIGLTMVKRCIDECQGSIELTSERGKGTRFDIRLPFSSPTREPVSDETDERQSTTPPRRILIIDDEPAIREILARILNSMGHATVEAGSAAEGLEKREDIDLVISDCLMPGTSGIEFAEKLQMVAPDIPVFLFSGDQNAINQPTPDNVRGFIMKPFDLQDLQDMLSYSD